ncbi:uncharacterized protein LOC107697793 [Sinocyclocheilus anshuiensis]|uniref:uncharacterized protein LOC107697793 n=1 Tax=Sinocyclocheilus anshuiensis TaxID=1608454 RepID=UPI0007B85BCB|nr:PREDICTED: uncharacterized protein LOC107697793 [Sinocyclocheilus anshuiensis]
MAPFISSGDILLFVDVLAVEQCSAQTTVSESEQIFSEVLCSVQKTSVRVKELIAERQRYELSRIEGLQEKVQQKISDLRMKVSELDQFLTTEDHIHFLQNYPECMSEEFEDLSNISENPKAFFCNVELLLSEMQERLLDVTKETEIKIKSGEVVPPKADAPVSSSFIDFAKKDGDWDCEVCLVKNKGMSSHCVACQTSNPDMKSKSTSAPAFKFGFGSSPNQPATAGPLNAGFNQSKEKASIFGANRSTGRFTFGSRP